MSHRTGPGAWTGEGAALRPARPPSRLVGLASALVDVTLSVPHLPPRGGDVVAAATGSAAGGGVNALVAAARLGLPAVYGGPHGTGPNADAVRAALARDGVGLLAPARTDGDCGWCLALVEPDAERTFVTVPGVEARQSAAALAALPLRPDDAVYVSGYDLGYPVSGPPLAAWVAALPPVPDGGPLVVLDPGPLGGEVPAARMSEVLARTDLLTVSADDAGNWLDAAALPSSALLLVRADGARARLAGAAPDATLVQPRVEPPAPVLDSNGAGDAHLGALLAVLAAGEGLGRALLVAAHAAAWSVTRTGAATGPTRAELSAVLGAPAD